MHLIRIRKSKEYQRAIVTLLDIPRSEYLALPDDRFFINDEQLTALEEAGVKFELLSKTRKKKNGKKSSSI